MCYSLVIINILGRYLLLTNNGLSGSLHFWVYLEMLKEIWICILFYCANYKETKKIYVDCLQLFFPCCVGFRTSTAIIDYVRLWWYQTDIMEPRKVPRLLEAFKYLLLQFSHCSFHKNKKELHFGLLYWQ